MKYKAYKRIFRDEETLNAMLADRAGTPEKGSLSFLLLAEKYGVDHTSILHWCRKKGIKPLYKLVRKVSHKPIKRHKPAKTKICTKCKKTKPNTDFCSSKYLIKGIQSWCKECKKARQAEHRVEQGLKPSGGARKPNPHFIPKRLVDGSSINLGQNYKDYFKNNE